MEKYGINRVGTADFELITRPATEKPYFEGI